MLKYQILRDYDNAIIHLKDKLGVRSTSNTQPLVINSLEQNILELIVQMIILHQIK